MGEETKSVDAYERGSRASLVESFEIRGLHGYKNISLNMPYAAGIVIASNGSGKTTLLGALDAFLKGQFSRLRGLSFDEIRCRIRGINDELIVKRTDVDSYLESSSSKEFEKIAKRIEVEPRNLFKFIVEDFSRVNRVDFWRFENDTFDAILRSVSYQEQDAFDLCTSIARSINIEENPIFKVQIDLSTRLSEIEVVYLPTYRRIELSLEENEADRPRSRRRRDFKFLPATNLFTGDIQFGLRDIRDRLQELNRKISVESNSGYRKLSADIIKDLFYGTYDDNDFDNDNNLPDQDALKLFFSRLQRGDQHPYNPYLNVPVPELNWENLKDSSRKTLRYFLFKLNSVINSTRGTELRVEDFITVCNRYLAGGKSLSPVSEGDVVDRHSIDSKYFRFNRESLEVSLISRLSGRPMTFESLSSGEKQMVSLFSRLYLYEKEKLLLIDEPELSLSLDWQRNILVDLISASSCRQIVAITHSPFIFDNCLEPFASSLGLSVDFSDVISGSFADD